MRLVPFRPNTSCRLSPKVNILYSDISVWLDSHYAGEELRQPGSIVKPCTADRRGSPECVPPGEWHWQGSFLLIALILVIMNVKHSAQTE